MLKPRMQLVPKTIMNKRKLTGFVQNDFNHMYELLPQLQSYYCEIKIQLS